MSFIRLVASLPGCDTQITGEVSSIRYTGDGKKLQGALEEYACGVARGTTSKALTVDLGGGAKAEIRHASGNTWHLEITPGLHFEEAAYLRSATNQLPPPIARARAARAGFSGDLADLAKFMARVHNLFTRR